MSYRSGHGADRPRYPLTLEGARALLALLHAGVGIAPGMSERELDRVEERWKFRFAPEHRVLLGEGLPLGSRSRPDWRDGEPEDLARRLAWPVDAVPFDVERNGFWHPRPAATQDALDLARAHLADAPGWCRSTPTATCSAPRTAPAPRCCRCIRRTSSGPRHVKCPGAMRYRGLNGDLEGAVATAVLAVDEGESLQSGGIATRTGIPHSRQLLERPVECRATASPRARSLCRSGDPPSAG